MNRIFNCKQQSDLWQAAHRGRITGSGLGNVMAPPTTKASERKGVKCAAGTEALCRAEYRQKLAVERITKRAVNNFVTRAMEDGLEREPYARMLYEAETQQVVELVGFALHPEWDWFGCSPDGLCGDDGGVEFKCPTEMIHCAYMDDVALLVGEYQWQVVGNLICFPERQWWDLVSFNPYFPDALKLIRFRLHRSEFADTIRAVEEAAPEFNLEVEAQVTKRGLPQTVWDVMPKEAAPEDTSPPMKPYDNTKEFKDQDYGFLDGNRSDLIEAV